MKMKWLFVSIIVIFIVVLLFRSIGFNSKSNVLTANEMSIMEKFLGVSFPVSTTEVKFFVNSYGWLYCFASFDQRDLEYFKKNRTWVSMQSPNSLTRKEAESILGQKTGGIAMDEVISIVRDKADLIAARSSVAPFKRKRIIPKRLKWWNVNKSNLLFVSMDIIESEIGNVDFLLESTSNEMVNCYIVRQIDTTFYIPATKKIFTIDGEKIYFRESKPFPKRDKTMTRTGG